MGLQIGEIISKKEISFKDLKNKIIVVDAFNTLYQFLTTVRQPDGTPLMDNQGDITSHLSGLFYRNLNLILNGIKLIYVFDGEPPDLKKTTKGFREDAKKIARQKYQEARSLQDIEGMGKYSKRDVSLDAVKIKESKELLKAMGIAIVQAPGEGEAQASYLVNKNPEFYAVSSQDYDCLMFKATKLIQNLSLARRKRTISGFKEVFPQIIELDKTLKELGINQEQLICLGVLCGTDYNPRGIKGLGPKKSLKLVQEFKTKEKIFEEIKNNEKYEMNFDWKEIYEEIDNPNVKKNIQIEFPKINKEKIKEILLKHDFSEKRIEHQFEKLDELNKRKAQRTLFQNL